MTLNYFLCPISVKKPENVHFEGIYLFSMDQHTETINSAIKCHYRYITSTQKFFNMGLYQGSKDRCEVNHDSDLNRLDSAILSQ